jgi:hypothetical protein
MPTFTSQSTAVAQPAPSPVTSHSFATPVVHAIPRGAAEPASHASIW